MHYFDNSAMLVSFIECLLDVVRLVVFVLPSSMVMNYGEVNDRVRETALSVRSVQKAAAASHAVSHSLNLITC